MSDDQGSELERRLGARLGLAAPVLCRSGREGFLGVLLALELGAADEVVLPVSICQTMVNAVLIAGAVPVLADCRRDLSLCPADLARRIGPATRVIVANHPHGAACRLDEVRALAATVGALVVEDCAQAAGAWLDGAPVGHRADVALHSFAADKPLHAGGGGLVAARDPALAARLRAALRVGSPGHRDDEALGIDSLPDPMRCMAIARALDRFDADLAVRVANAEAIIAAIGMWGRVVGRDAAGRRPHAHVFHRVVVELRDCTSRDALAVLDRVAPDARAAVVQDAVPVPPHRAPHVVRAYERRGRALSDDEFPGWRAIERSYVFLRTSAHLSPAALEQAVTALAAAADPGGGARWRR